MNENLKFRIVPKYVQLVYDSTNRIVQRLLMAKCEDFRNDASIACEYINRVTDRVTVCERVCQGVYRLKFEFIFLDREFDSWIVLEIE